MFEKRCSLCGGKLKGNICTECGLDNSKSDANYISSGSTHHTGEGLTHEHKDGENPMAGKTVTKEWMEQEKRASKERRQHSVKTASQTYSASPYHSSSYQTSASQGRKKKKFPVIGIVFVILIIFSVCSSIIDAVKDEFEDWDSGSDSFWEDNTTGSTDYTDDPYAFAERELSDDGEVYDVDLTAGVYKGGVHIPEGAYRVTFVPEAGNEENSYMELSLDDYDNSIYYHEYMSVDEITEIEDLRIYEDAFLEIEGRGTLMFHSENAQTDEMESIANPNTESYTVENSFRVGKDVAPGVYDVICESGSGIFDYTVEDSDGYQHYCGKLIGDMDSGFAGELKNIVLPKGVTVEIEGMRVQLIPSARIESEDYVEFFDNY